MTKSLFIFFLIVTLSACSASKQTPSAIGLVTLRNYAINEKVDLQEDVTFEIFTNSTDFQHFFHMTKSTPATVVVPDFNKQQVVAVILKPSTKVRSLSIDKANISGTDLNIYYSLTDTTKWATYEQVEAVAATVPKALNVKNANFYKDSIKEKTLPVVY
jgi:hypothetical protein